MKTVYSGHFNRRYLKELESRGTFKFPADSVLIAKVEAEHLNKTKLEFLEKPFDQMYLYIFEITAAMTAQKIQDCVGVFSVEDKAYFFIIPSDIRHPVYNNDAQKLSSHISSLMTSELIKNSDTVIASYMDTLDEKAENMSDEDCEVVINRINNISEFFDNDVLFQTHVFPVPDVELEDYILFQYQDHFRNAINSLGRYYLDKPIDGMSYTDVKKALKKKGGILDSQESYFDYFLYGSLITKNSRMDIFSGNTQLNDENLNDWQKIILTKNL